MNNTNLIGRFTRDPELRYTPDGTAVSNYTLAVRNPFNKDGNADFIQCVSWGAGAELVAEKHVTGNLVGVSGRLQSRSYQNNDGQTVYVTEVNVHDIHLIQTKDYAENAAKANNKNNSNNNGNGKNNGSNKNNGNGNNRANNRANNRNQNNNNNN